MYRGLARPPQSYKVDSFENIVFVTDSIHYGYSNSEQTAVRIGRFHGFLNC